MIRLTNLSKTYNTQDKGSVRALDDVNLNFPDKGFCLVVGQSGCGKTTLLNILGGLDVKYDGELAVFDKTLKAKDFADYRKNYVSFVFQDFNLIEDLDVSENLSIGYNFATKDDGNQIEDALNKVGLEDYGYRFPQELSGGEQQRVAIARALLKDSRVLLADEPTGNLDKQNSVDIYNLLKEISLKKLVIVVSHDEQLGLKYADYVVRLEEGKVVESNLPQSECAGQYAVSKRKAIRARIALQMAWYEFTRKKSRSIVTVIALMICLSLVSFAMPLFFYNSADPHYALATEYGYDKILLKDLTYQTYCELRDKGVNLALSNVDGDINNTSLVFQSKQEALDYGIEFYPCDNELPLRSDTYYISDQYLMELIINGNNKAVIDGQKVELNLTDFELTDVVGGYLDEFGHAKICGGVYHSPEQSDNMSPEEKYRTAWYGKYIQTELYGQTTPLGENLLPVYVRIYCGEQIAYFPDGRTCYGVLTADNKYLPGEVNGNNYYLLDEQGNLTFLSEYSCNYLLSEDGVYFNLAAYNGIFFKNYTPNDLLRGGIVPQELGKEVSIEAENRNTGQIERLDGLKLKGIVINTSGIKGYKIWLSNQDDLLKYKLSVSNFYAWADLADVAPKFNGMRSLSRDYGCGFITSVSYYADNFEKFQLENITATVVYIAVAMSVVSVLSIGLLISGQILSRKREVGIFKALGAKSIDIAMIYVYEAVIVAVLIIAFSIVLAVLATLLFNLILFNGATVTYFHWTYALLGAAVMAVLFTVGTLLPVLRLNSLNVIESIRSKSDK